MYGTAKQVKANRSKIRQELSRLGKLQFISDGRIGVLKASDEVAPSCRISQRGFGRFRSKEGRWKAIVTLEFFPHVHAIEKGYPSDYFVKHAYYKAHSPKPADNDIDPARDRCGLIWLGPMVPLDGRHVQEVLDLCQPLYEKYGFEFSTALMVGNPRTLIALMSIFYDREDAGEVERAKQLYFEMGKVTQDAGYQQYRTSTIFMDRVLNRLPSSEIWRNASSMHSTPTISSLPANTGFVELLRSSNSPA